MHKISLAIIFSLLFYIIVNFKFLALIENKEILVRLTIFFSLFVGLYTAIKLNKKNINKFFLNKNSFDKNRIKYKFLVVIFIWLISLFFSFFMSIFLDYDLYDYYFYDSIIYSPIILFCLLFWIIFFDKRMHDPNDQYYKILVDIKNNNLKIREFKLFFLSNAIKIFYLPYIYGASFLAIETLLTYENYSYNYIIFMEFLFFLGVSFDVVIAFGGYLFSSKYFSTENISIDDSWKGWFVCLICYPPLLIVSKKILSQQDEYIWSDWLIMDGILFWFWSFLILVSWLCYWASTVSFGFRFSNLSWRGLVDTGLYKYVKHPAYLSKNIYWWLHTVPFFGVLGWDIWFNLLALSSISFIYYLRAKTEEKHLMKFQEYRDYCTWIEENGLYAKVKKIIKIG